MFESLPNGKVEYDPEIDELTVVLPPPDPQSGGTEFARDLGLDDPADYVMVERDIQTGTPLIVTVQPFTPWLAYVLGAGFQRRQHAPESSDP